MNVVNLIGRLGQDPELKTTQSGKSVCSFSLAVKGMKADEVDWVRIVAWEKTAETIANYCAKGREIAIEGRISVRNWEDEGGNKRQSVEVVANRFHFIGPKPEDGAAGEAKPKAAAAPKQESIEDFDPFSEE